MQFSKSNNYLFPLDSMGIIDLVGDASRDFLQGQISCDLREVNAGQIQQGAMCNLKGRVLALIDVIDWQGIKLLLPQNLLEQTKTTLAKTALLSRVKLEQNSNLTTFGFYYADKQGLKPTGLDLPQQRLSLEQNQNACCYALTDSLFIWVIQNEAVDELTKPFVDAGLMASEAQWHELTLSQKIIQIYPETSGEFLPHRMDLHLSGYLSFNKGCYKGQEIIARTHYRAKLKHELGLFTIDSSLMIKPGMRLVNPQDNSELGEIIDCHKIDEKQWLLAVSILFEHPDEVLIDDCCVRLKTI